MNTLKKGITVLAIIALIVCSIFIVLYTVICTKSSLCFMLVMNGIIPPIGVSAKEVTLPLKNNDSTKMTIYSRIFSKENKYYFCVHGMTPQGYTHPSLVKLAKALALATGRKIMVPYLRGSETSRDILDATGEIYTMYYEVKKQYPGKYNGFGACIAGTMLIAALKDVPTGLYPDKIFMYGPFLNGEMLMNFYNTSGVEVDFIVKLANAARHKTLSDEERDRVNEAIKATKPGITDTQEVKKILGEELYKKVDALKIENPEFKAINEMTLFSKKRQLPNCKYYILHARSDNVIPYSMGLSMHKYLLQLGLQSRFVATGAFQHTEKATIKELMHEFKEIQAFFDDLFSEEGL